MDFFCPQEDGAFKANKDNLTSDDDVCENKFSNSDDCQDDEFPSSDDCEDDLIDSAASIVYSDKYSSDSASEILDYKPSKDCQKDESSNRNVC